MEGIPRAYGSKTHVQDTCRHMGERHKGAVMNEPGERETAEPSETRWSAEVGAELNSKLPKIVPFRDLCRCGDEVWIENEGQLYRLRRTRQGKLILTK